MKTLLTFISILFTSVAFGQIDILEFSGSDDSDSVYNFHDSNTYLSSPNDTLKFYDGIKDYLVVEKTFYRNDTVVETPKASWTFKKSTYKRNIKSTVFQTTYKPLRNAIIDTIRDADDPTIILEVRQRDSIEIEFAKSYNLSQVDFYQTIAELKKEIHNQGLTIQLIWNTFYGDKIRGIDMDITKDSDFENVDFISTIILISKDNVMLDYHLIFSKTVANTK